MNKNFSLPALGHNHVISPGAHDLPNIPSTTLASSSLLASTSKYYNPRNYFTLDPSNAKSQQHPQVPGEDYMHGGSPSGNATTLETPEKGYRALSHPVRWKGPNEPNRDDIMSRETIARFYEKEARGSRDIQKRLQTRSYIGKDSALLYYKKYKKLEKIQELDPKGYSASTAYLINAHQLKILPSSTLGLIKYDKAGMNNEEVVLDPAAEEKKSKHQLDYEERKRKSERDRVENSICAQNLKLGKSYALALSSSMKHLTNVERVELQGNRLGKVGGSSILTSLSKAVKILNLDNNKIGSQGLHLLVNWVANFESGHCPLEELSLENNDFGDEITVDLANALTETGKNLKILNMNHNRISDKGAKAISDFMNGHYTLEVLKLGWNKIKTAGGVALAEQLKDNKYVKVFDISFN